MHSNVGTDSIKSLKLPTAALALVERALREEDLSIASDFACEALRAVRFALAKDHELGICLPRELSDEQKAVALALSDRDELATRRFALPSGKQVVARWLGVAPPTLLEAIVTYDTSDGATRTEPRWARYRRQRTNVSLADIEHKDNVEALELVIALLDDAYAVHLDPSVAQTVVRAVGAKGLPIAQRTLDELSPRVESARDTEERARLTKNKDFIQHAFVSAAAPFDPRIVPFLTFLPCNDDELIALVRWLPEALRDDLVLEVLQRDSLSAVDTGAKILRHFALPKTAAYVAFQHNDDSPDHQAPVSVKKRVAGLIEQAAKSQPSIAEALAPALSPAARKSLGVKAPRSSPKASTPTWSPLPPKTPLPDRVGHFIDGLQAGCLRGKNARLLRDEGIALLDLIFRKQAPVCRRPHTLSELERALLTNYLEHLGHPYLLDGGLWDHSNEIQRILGLAPPSSHDVDLDLDGERAPAWCWIREHLHRSAPTREVLVDAVLNLDERPRFALFTGFFTAPSLARETYSYWQGIERIDTGAPPSRQPPPGPHRARLCRLVAALAWALGTQAERFVTARALDASEFKRPNLLDGALAFSSLNFIAHKRAQTLDARWTDAQGCIVAFDDVKRDPALRAAILDEETPPTA
jgi:hypothetical protein